MKYKTREGVVLTSVCGQYVLVAAKRARKKCPYISLINETAAFCWRLLEKGSTIDELVDHLGEEYEIEDIPRVTDDISKMINRFMEEGYLIEGENNDEEK